ncbi:MAG: helix-turn-helix domain-containing protein, partial [Gordonia amarae]
MAEGLREKSRVRRRTAMEGTAMRLFAEQGYEATTIVQVAAEAGVSTRTLTLYFPTKLDLALAYSAAASERLSQACGSRADDETVLDVVRSWLAREVAECPGQIAAHAAMLAANPVLR